MLVEGFKTTLIFKLNIMPIRIIKPTSNARREMTVLITNTDKKRPEKSLTFRLNKKSGRNCYGRITAQNRGGGSKTMYRLIDFKQIDVAGLKADVIAIEYDPNRTANIALVQYPSGEKRYVIAPEGLAKGDNIVCDEKAPIRVGNRLKLKNIPPSTQIYNIELQPGRGGQIIRSAGGYAILLGVDKEYAQIKMPSGEIRKVLAENFASIGVVSNADHSKVSIGKAGRVRLSGRRPHVRGKAKNPCDHPHGGGEGNTSIGMTHPKTPWGMPALGHKTRSRSKSSRLIVKKARK